MHRIFLLPAVLLLIVSASCKRSDPAPCAAPENCGDGLRFRLTDSGGHDVLCGPAMRLSKDSLLASQACATASLTPRFTIYATPGSADSSIVLQFPNLRTPVYGESGNCFKVLFRWSAADTDTLDWHYRIDDRDGCPVQVIDYLSYNGRQSAKVHNNNDDYYQLIK